MLINNIKNKDAYYSEIASLLQKLAENESANSKNELLTHCKFISKEILLTNTTFDKRA